MRRLCIAGVSRIINWSLLSRVRPLYYTHSIGRLSRLINRLERRSGVGTCHSGSARQIRRLPLTLWTPYAKSPQQNRKFSIQRNFCLLRGRLSVPLAFRGDEGRTQLNWHTMLGNTALFFHKKTHGPDDRHDIRSPAICR